MNNICTCGHQDKDHDPVVGCTVRGEMKMICNCGGFAPQKSKRLTYPSKEMPNPAAHDNEGWAGKFYKEFGKDQYGGEKAFRQDYVRDFIATEIAAAKKETKESLILEAKKKIGELDGESFTRGQGYAAFTDRYLYESEVLHLLDTLQ
jgi:hypothetical protein